MPVKIEFRHLGQTMKKLKDEEQIDSFLGAMMTTQGVLLVFFSHRFNRQHPLLVSGSETTKVISEMAQYL